MSKALIHAYSGCDTTSSFRGHGKKSAWKTWKSFDESTRAFLFLVENPITCLTMEDNGFQTLQKFTIILYDLNSLLTSVNDCRKELFCKKKRAMDCFLLQGQLTLFLFLYIFWKLTSDSQQAV